MLTTAGLTISPTAFQEKDDTSAAGCKAGKKKKENMAVLPLTTHPRPAAPRLWPSVPPTGVPLAPEPYRIHTPIKYFSPPDPRRESPARQPIGKRTPSQDPSASNEVLLSRPWVGGRRPRSLIGRELCELECGRGGCPVDGGPVHSARPLEEARPALGGGPEGDLELHGRQGTPERDATHLAAVDEERDLRAAPRGEEGGVGQ
jgi:hypothetical protein